MPTKPFLSLIGVVCLSFGCSTPSFAMTSWNEFLPQPLVRSDMEHMKEVSRVELTGKEPGTTLPWKNPETLLEGTVTLIKYFKIKENECREILHEVTFKNQQVIDFHATLCQGKEGRWEVLPFIFKSI